jgi:hypothetical protein
MTWNSQTYVLIRPIGAREVLTGKSGVKFNLVTPARETFNHPLGRFNCTT